MRILSRTVSTLRPVLTRTARTRLLLGWAAALGIPPTLPLLGDPLTTPALIALLAAIVVVIVLCAFGVVAEAEQLAHRLGEPYGTLVLTLSIVVIEVILIAAVLLGPGAHPTIARDSVMAVSMIILNLVVGAALLVGGLRHGELRPNRAGASAYLALLTVLLAAGLVLPGLIGIDGAYSAAQAIPILVLTLVLYVFLLIRQTGAQRADFRESASRSRVGSTAPVRPLAEQRGEVVARAALLVLTVLPIVLLSHELAGLLDEGLARASAPAALAGLLIAMIVFLPETITTIRAAASGEIQRVSNLCHGALVSTVGLTIPAVLLIGLTTGRPVVLAAGPAELALLAATMVLTAVSFLGGRITPLHGAAHLGLFGLYLVATLA